MAATKEYDSALYDDWVWSLSVDGLSHAEIAKVIGVSKRTLNQWSREHDSFKQALAASKEVADAEVMRALHRRAVGYEYTEKKRVAVLDAEGNERKSKEEENQKKVVPDVAAQRFWLKNRQSGTWKDKIDSVLSADSEVEVQLYLPDNGRD